MQGGLGQKNRGVGSMESASQRCRSSKWELSCRSGYEAWGRGQGRRLWWEAGPVRKKSCRIKGRRPARRRRSGGTAPRGSGPAVTTQRHGGPGWSRPRRREWRCGGPGRGPAQGLVGAL